MRYKNIMVAIDGSHTSHLALNEAIQLTKDQNAQLQIIYVVDEAVVKFTDEGINFTALWDVYKDEGLEILNKVADEVKPFNINFETRLIILKAFEGRIAEKIVEEAQAWPADLLVIGTHGRHGVSHFFLGSVAEKVLRIAPMPVLLIRSK